MQFAAANLASFCFRLDAHLFLFGVWLFSFHLSLHLILYLFSGFILFNSSHLLFNILLGLLSSGLCKLFLGPTVFCGPQNFEPSRGNRDFTTETEPRKFTA